MSLAASISFALWTGTIGLVIGLIIGYELRKREGRKTPP